MATNVTVYDFQRQFGQGAEGEHFLDWVFHPSYDIRPVTDDEQRTGIDRWYRQRPSAASFLGISRERFSVEYKTDFKMADTGNVFIETVSVDTSGKAGWVYTSQAEVLLFHDPRKCIAYVAYMLRVRAKVDDWKAWYPEKAVRNGEYFTHGMPVPITEYQAVCEKRLDTTPFMALWKLQRWTLDAKAG